MRSQVFGTIMAIVGLGLGGCGQDKTVSEADVHGTVRDRAAIGAWTVTDVRWNHSGEQFSVTFTARRGSRTTHVAVVSDEPSGVGRTLVPRRWRGGGIGCAGIAVYEDPRSTSAGPDAGSAVADALFVSKAPDAYCMG